MPVSQLESVPGMLSFSAHVSPSPSPTKRNGLTLSSDTYASVLERNVVQKDVNQIVPFTLARAGYDRRLLEMEDSSE
jgi:hypothetical protein